MYERFTEEAREAMRLANQEAMRLRHEYIAPADIILGIARLEDARAVRVLRLVGVSIDPLRTAIESIYSGDPMIGRERVPQVPRAKRVIERAIEQARSLGHDHVGSEHILLGLLGTEDAVVSEALKRSGLDAGKLEEDVVRLLKGSGEGGDGDGPPERDTT